MVHK
jgi:hypothetical protein